MSEKMIRSDERDSESHKEEVSKEMGVTDEDCATKWYRLIFAFLPVIGINIKEGKSTTYNVIRMFYLFILLLISVWLAGCQLYPMLSDEFTTESSWYISGTDQYVVMAIIYVAAFKNHEIGQLLKDTWTIYNETADIRGANRRLMRWFWVFALITLVSIIVLGSIAVVTALVVHDPIDLFEFPKEYFGIETKNVAVIRCVTLVTNVAVQFYVIMLYLFGCFAIIQCFLIKECFKGLNVTLRANGDGYLCDYLIKHRKICGIVNRFNETFHPAILVLVCILMMQIVTLTEDISKLIQTDDRSYLSISEYMMYLVQTTMIFTIFVYFGNEIQSEARNGIEILLESSISNTSSSNEELPDNKNDQMISLFIAQLNTAPVAISASGIFDINVNLITIVISIAITYLTFVSSLKSGKSKRVIAPTMASYNLSISSLPDNSSYTP